MVSAHPAVQVVSEAKSSHLPLTAPVGSKAATTEQFTAGGRAPKGKQREPTLPPVNLEGNISLLRTLPGHQVAFYLAVAILA